MRLPVVSRWITVSHSKSWTLGWTNYSSQQAVIFASEEHSNRLVLGWREPLAAKKDGDAGK